MKTTKEGRATMRKFAATKALHSNRAFNPRYALDRIADVDDAARLLGVVLEEIKNGEIETNYSQRVCAKSIANFLKEPKR